MKSCDVLKSRVRKLWSEQNQDNWFLLCGAVQRYIALNHNIVNRMVSCLAKLSIRLNSILKHFTVRSITGSVSSRIKVR